MEKDEGYDGTEEYVYDGPPCPHGQDDPWDCSICSAAGFGGSTFRTCRHGYVRGECPTCDGAMEEAS